MKCRIAKASLFALLCAGLVHAAPPTGSSLYQFTLAKVQGVLTGTKDASHIVDGSGNCRLLYNTDMPAEVQFTQAGAANSSLSHIWSDGNAGSLMLGVPNAKTVTSTINGTEYFSLGKYDGYINAMCWAIGRQTPTTPYIKAGTASVYLNSVGDFLFYRQASQQLAIGPGGITSFASGLGTTVNSTISLISDAANTLAANVPSGGTLRAMVNGTTVASVSGAGLALASGKYQAALATPANATATGAAGQVAWDTDFIYVCTATNTWKRAAIATWP